MSSPSEEAFSRVPGPRARWKIFEGRNEGLDRTCSNAMRAGSPLYKPLAESCVGRRAHRSPSRQSHGLGRGRRAADPSTDLRPTSGRDSSANRYDMYLHWSSRGLLCVAPATVRVSSCTTPGVWILTSCSRSLSHGRTVDGTWSPEVLQEVVPTRGP